ncbi:heparan-alpha-glucosaminide N-acetyltransferase [Aquamicrobium soli]|jgi:uncharacterized membrane protein|uniref:Heparan-alpha-glucosaminide N-acetyltransferase n=1 Tax=Aquamicrobium soli TaxID=1811518 RepID=A0ABV7KDA0_9HYPH
MSIDPPAPPALASKRIIAIDVARGLALLAMASYHFTWDLGFFGYTDPSLTAFGGWKLYARCIASTFLFLVGVSLVLAHGRGIRWRGFWRRLAMVGGAALAITAVTLVAIPDEFIFFGILHEITVASLLGLLFVRLPGLLTLLVAALVIAAPFFLSFGLFDHPLLWWVGLSTVIPRSNDYVPIFPWFGAVLAGIGATRLAVTSGLLAWLGTFPANRFVRPLVFIGRHSLAFYLIHQPVLIACVWLFSQISPAPVQTNEQGFLHSCAASCEETRDSAFCTAYCGCMLDALGKDGTLQRMSGGHEDPELRAHVTEMAGMCTATTDEAVTGGETQ